MNDTKPTFSFGQEENTHAHCEEMREEAETIGQEVKEAVDRIDIALNELRIKLAILHRLAMMVTELKLVREE